jgi:hypothetical protein
MVLGCENGAIYFLESNDLIKEKYVDRQRNKRTCDILLNEIMVDALCRVRSCI